MHFMQILAIMLLSFSAHDLYYARNYAIWSRILYFVFSVLLFLAAVCLFSGLRRVIWLLSFVELFHRYVITTLCVYPKLYFLLQQIPTYIYLYSYVSEFPAVTRRVDFGVCQLCPVRDHLGVLQHLLLH